MKKYISFALFSTILFFSCYFTVDAQNNQAYERIDSFVSDITVNKDSSINVIETIKYNSDGIIKHGIYRDIRLLSSNNEYLDISNITVVDENNISYEFSEDISSRKVSLKIGNPNITFFGEKIYIIKYTIHGAIGYFDKYDEIYWNVTGNDWTFPIEKTIATIHLPDGASVLQSASYCGPLGSNNPCIKNEDTIYHYNKLESGEGMTVAVGFPKGVVVQAKNFISPIFNYGGFLFLIIPIITFIFMFKRWDKYGRDPKSNRTIISQYDVPDGLTPLEVAGIVNQGLFGKSISAEIIYLAVNGYIKIEKIEKETFFSKSEDYILKKISNEVPVNETDKILIDKLFSGSSSEVKLSSLSGKFYVYTEQIFKNVFDKLITNGYLKNNPQKEFMFYGFTAFSSLSVGWFIASFFEPNFISVICVLISAIIVLVFGFLMPARTEKGLLTKEYLLGLKLYLDIAEKDRINFHNAPEKKPEVFEKFLPYAMIFGVEKAWAKEFEGIYIEPPKWYSDPGMSNFNTIVFANSLNNFTSYSHNALSSAPGGSGGGGSSGGGGGGGGGGSW